MLDMISKVVASILQISSSIIVMKKLLKNNSKISSWRNFALLVVFVFVTVIVYNIDYNPVAPLIIYLTMILFYKIIFKINLSASVLSVAIIVIICMLADVINSMIFLQFVSLGTIRSNPIVFMLSNFSVSVISVLIIYIKPINVILSKFIEKVSNREVYEKILFLCSVVIVLIFILYNLSIFSSLGQNYLINIVIMLIFIVLTCIYMKEKNNKEKITNEYDRLMEYVESFENWIEDEQLNNHEYKNQLAVIRGMVKSNKKVIEYIDNIIKDDIYVEDFWVNEIKHLPSGGIKGLLYYKLILTKKENIDICLSVSRDTKNFIKDVESIELKNIYRLLGIYLDNAIEAAKESDNKVISLEIYPLNSKLMIVISNTYSGNVDIKKMKKKGYTTKGKGHGNGLYYADKIVKRSSILESENSIINNYYVQKLIITKKEI